MIELILFDETGFDILISWIDTPEALMQFAGPDYSFPLTHEQLVAAAGDERRIAFKAIHTETGTMIGYAEIFIGKETAYLGRILIGDPNLRGRGYGQAIVRQLVDIAFGEMKQHKLSLNVFDFNCSAIRCYEKVGFVVNEGLQLQREVNGKMWVTVNMTLGKSKWMEQKKQAEEAELEN